MKCIFLIVIVLGIITDTHAASFCPQNSAELQTALDTASANGEHDVIKLSQQTYSTISTFNISLLENFDLEISGGWSDFNGFVCVFQSGNPESTIINGNDSTTLFNIGNDGQNYIEISNLTIEHGNTISNYFTGGIQLFNGNNHLGETLIERVYFKYNNSYAASALRIIGGDSVTIRNSVFYSNWSKQGNGAVDLFLRQEARGLYFTNNTIISNYSHNPLSIKTSKGFATGGLQVELNTNDNSTEALIANNIFWANGGLDWNISETGVYHVFNNRYVAGNGTADFSANNFSDLPQIPMAINDPNNDFTPDIASPAVDFGFEGSYNTPFLTAWQPGSEDFNRGFGGRVINGRIDIGAVEAPPETPIFEDGFE